MQREPAMRQANWRLAWGDMKLAPGVHVMPEIEHVSTHADRYHRIAWNVERATWVLLMSLLTAAALGLLGRGPLSSTTAGEPTDPVRLEYERFLHQQTPSRIVVRLHVPEHQAQPLQLWISQSLVDRLSLESVTPEPVRMQAVADGVVLHIDAQPAEQIQVQLRVRPLGFGRLQGRIGLYEGFALDAWLLVYP